MKIRPWLAAAIGVTAMTFGFSTGASAGTHHVAPFRLAPGFVEARHLPAAKLPRMSPAKVDYGNWAGYMAVADKNVSLRYVAADFNVPSLNCAAAPNAAVVLVVGLQYWNASGEITGIAGECNPDGTYSYQGLYDIGSSQVSSSATISPGDAIRASVYHDASTGKYSFYLEDVTTSTAVFNTAVSCPSGSKCSTTTAEVVTDDPYSSSGQVLPLADYGMDNVTGGRVTSRNGFKGGFGPSNLWTSTELIMSNQSGSAVIASPSSLEGGSAFSTTWHAAS